MTATSERVVILAGAGLSVGAKLPTSMELASKLKSTLQGLSRGDRVGPTAEKTRQQATTGLALFNFLDGGIRFQEGVLDRDPDAPINIEQIAVAAEQLIARQLNPLAPYISGWHQRINELLAPEPEILKSFLDFIYAQLNSWLTLTNSKDAYYMARLADLCDVASGVDIFTLNYDLGVETALTTAKKTFCNGFQDGGTWNPAQLEKQERIRLLKLHGSLDWVEDEIYGICSLEFPRHENAENMIGEETRPALIFGTANKLSPREPFLTLAYYFSKSVLRSPVLAVIGYSFGDEYVNQIIEQGIRRNPKLRVVVVSPNASKSIEKLSFLRGYPRVTHIDEKAEVALNTGSLLARIGENLDDIEEEEPFHA